MKKLSDSEIITPIKLPFYVKLTIVLVGLYVLFCILYIAKDIIVPLIFSMMIAVLLNPIVNFFIRKKLNVVVAIILTLLLTVSVTSAIAILMFTEISQLGDSWSMLVDKFAQVVNEFTRWIARYFDLSPWEVNKWVANAKIRTVKY